MNYLDIIFLIPLCFFLIQGFRKGVIIELLSILALLIAIIGSMTITHAIVIRFFGEAESPILPYIAYVAVFITLFLLVILFAKLIEKIVKTAQLNFINRLAGALFGAFKAVIIVSLIFWVSGKAGFITDEKAEASFFYLKLRSVAPAIIDFITNNLNIAKDLISNIEDFFSLLADKIE